MSKNIKNSIVIILLLGGCLLTGIIISEFLNFGVVEQTRFTSPSGKKTVIVEEFCMGFACGQTAYLRVWPLKQRLCNLNVGDLEKYVFHSATVEWSDDEGKMT